MQVALLCYTRRVPLVNLQRGAWMNVLKNAWSHARAGREINRWGVAIAAVLATLIAMTSTASAQAPAPKRTVIRAGRVLNVRTGELQTNQTIVIEGDKIARTAPSREVTAAGRDTTNDLPDPTVLPGSVYMHPHLPSDMHSLGDHNVPT